MSLNAKQRRSMARAAEARAQSLREYEAAMWREWKRRRERELLAIAAVTAAAPYSPMPFVLPDGEVSVVTFASPDGEVFTVAAQDRALVRSVLDSERAERAEREKAKAANG